MGRVGRLPNVALEETLIYLLLIPVESVLFSSKLSGTTPSAFASSKF